MRCPRCKRELPTYILDPEYDFQRCDCGRCFKLDEIRRLVEAEDCLLVREGDIMSEDFSTDWCEDCSASCILGNPDAGNVDLVQDEENNWVYPEDLSEMEDV